MDFKKKITVAISIIIFLVIIFFAYNKGMFDFGGNKLLSIIKNQPEMIKIYNKAIKEEEKNKENPEEEILYFQLGLDWKSIGEQMEGEEEEKNMFFQKSLEVYELGAERFGEKNVLFFLNAGNVAQRIGELEKAESHYKKAMEIAPADETAYISLVNLYYYRMKKTKEEILPIFGQGIERMFDPTPLISARATYLRRVEANREALEDYKLLSAKFPDHPGYKEIIAELESKIFAN